jgi:hypothetical protein
MSIVNYERFSPSIDPAYFSATVSDNYWSATTYKNDTAYAWYVYFNGGGEGSSPKTSYSCYARCVRGQ